MKRFSQLLAGVALAGSIAAPFVVHAAAHDLQSEAKVSKPQAARTALLSVKGGHVRSAELEREHGRLIWSFDIARAGSNEITEVQVDAISGGIVSRKKESPAAEAREAKAEARADARAARQ